MSQTDPDAAALAAVVADDYRDDHNLADNAPIAVAVVYQVGGNNTVAYNGLA